MRLISDCRAFFSSVVLAAALLTLPSESLAQRGPDAEEPAQEVQGNLPPVLRDLVSRMAAAAGEVGPWEEQYAQMIDATERVYRRNGWDSESDQFSLDVLREVNALEPWRIQDRFDTFVGMISDRYLLNRGQERELRRVLHTEGNAVIIRHAPQLMQITLEAIQTRAAGEPFTSDQVTRWAEIAGPIVQDARETLNKQASVLMEKLDPQQQQWLQQDLQAAIRRVDRFDEMRQTWTRGQWQPEDWGLEADPIQRGEGKREAGSAGAGARGGRDAARTDTANSRQPQPAGESSPPAAESPSADGTQPPRPARQQPASAPGGEPNDEWARYVRTFIVKFDLTEDQKQRAWQFYQASKQRAAQSDARFAAQLAALEKRPPGSEPDAAAKRVAELKEHRQAALDRLFAQLKSRLDQLPTRAQRRAAEPESPPAPRPSTQPAGEPSDAP